jgi:hypothetical protein
MAEDVGVAAGEATERQRQRRGHAGRGAAPEGRARRRSRVLADRRPSSGDFSDATLIRKFGEVSDDLSAL